MANSFFVKRGTTIRLESKESSTSFETLPVGTYTLQLHPMIGFYLEVIEPSPLPKKIYGSPVKDAHRILKTFLDRPRSTGALLYGDKGSGKTMLTRLISSLGAEQGIPTIIITQPYTGDAFNNFLHEIEQPCIILFDEFEKVYPRDEQKQLLTLMDGLFNSKKLYLLTANDRFGIDAHMQNRPGRLFYMLEYHGIGTDFIREYCLDNLKDTSKTEGVVAVSSLFFEFNFDMLQAIVEEMNRYDEPASEALRLLNCKPEAKERTAYILTVFDDAGNQVNMDSDDQEINRSPMLYPFFLNIGIGKANKNGGYKSYCNVSFKPENIVSIDSHAGVIQMKNECGYSAVLTKKTAKTFDLHSAYTLAEGAAL